MFNRNRKSAEPKRKHDLSKVNICINSENYYDIHLYEKITNLSYESELVYFADGLRLNKDSKVNTV